MRVHAQIPDPSHLAGNGRVRGAIAFALAASLVLVLLAVGQAARAQSPTLRALAAARGKFIGYAAATTGSNPLANEAAYRTIAGGQFNQVTAENAMKWDATEPSDNNYNFTGADQVVAFAQQNSQVVHGHTLVWHSQTPGWVQGLSATAMRTAMQDHIATVVGRYASNPAVQSWDVVNEAFNEDGTMRQSFWFNTLGQSYIADAFRFARAADGNARLCINDFNVEGINAKSTAMFNLVQSLRSQGVPIDCVGFQAHLAIQFGFPSQVAQNIQRFANLGVQVRFTELDVRMNLPRDASKDAQQATFYSNVFNACLASAACAGVTIWGFTDKYSWVPDTFGGQGAALIYDENYQPKPAVSAISQALGTGQTTTTNQQTTTTNQQTTTTNQQTTTTNQQTTTTGPPGGCRVAYAFQSVWQDGFVANLTVTNLGTSAINGWTVRWTFNNNAQITNMWNASRTQAGQAVAATNLDYNTTIGANGGSQGFGFQASYSGTAPTRPTSITLNNIACTVV